MISASISTSTSTSLSDYTWMIPRAPTSIWEGMRSDTGRTSWTVLHDARRCTKPKCPASPACVTVKFLPAFSCQFSQTPAVYNFNSTQLNLIYLSTYLLHSPRMALAATSFPPPARSLIRHCFFPTCCFLLPWVRGVRFLVFLFLCLFSTDSIVCV